MAEIIKKEPSAVTATTINGVPANVVKMMGKYLAGKGGSNVNDEQAWMFYVTCGGAKLNPFNNDCYAVFNRSKDGGYVLSIRTSYEVYITKAQEYRGGKHYFTHEPKFYALGKDVTYKAKKTPEEIADLSCEIIFYNIDGKVMRKQPPVHITEYKPIYKDKDGNIKHDNFWDGHPELMLEKCAVVRGLRLICGKAISGLGYIKEETQNVAEFQESIKPVEAKPVLEQPKAVKVSPAEALKKLGD